MKAEVTDVNNRGEMLVLLDRIELSTSPLPRECSTTELQQPVKAYGGFLACSCP